MGKNHIKRLAVPKTWPINRKTNTWIIKPKPGPHNLNECFSITTLLKEILNVCKTTREVKYALTNDLIKINGKIRKDKKFQVGLMDVVSFKNNYYRILLSKSRKLIPVKITKDEEKIRLKKIVGKKSLRKNKLQINLSGGENFISTKKDFKTNDTLVFVDGKLKEKLDFKEGSIIYIVGGKQIGTVGIIKKIEKTKSLQPKKIIFNDGKLDLETLRKFVFVIGKNKPIISLPK
jgi:small subunit ribosomal protein S4e